MSPTANIRKSWKERRYQFWHRAGLSPCVSAAWGWELLVQSNRQGIRVQLSESEASLASPPPQSATGLQRRSAIVLGVQEDQILNSIRTISQGRIVAPQVIWVAWCQGLNAEMIAMIMEAGAHYVARGLQDVRSIVKSSLAHAQTYPWEPLDCLRDLQSMMRD